MSEFTVPETVHAAQDGNGNLVLLNSATGCWHMLNRTGTDFYQALRATMDIDKAIDALIDRHPGVPADRIRMDVEALVSALVPRGLLVLGDVGRRAGGVLMAAPGNRVSITWQQRLAALAAFPLALLLLRLPFRTATNVVAGVRSRLARQDATGAEARGALSAARRVSRLHPGRVACLEMSLIAVLTAALLGRRVDWCFGSAVDPQSFHAWIEVAGEPVTDPADDPIPPTYRRILLV